MLFFHCTTQLYTVDMETEPSETILWNNSTYITQSYAHELFMMHLWWTRLLKHTTNMYSTVYVQFLFLHMLLCVCMTRPTDML